MDDLFTTANLLSLVTLTVMEVVLGVDNIVFISILSGKLPPDQQGKARNIGLVLALFARLGLLFSITWVMSLTRPLFEIPILHHSMSGKDLIMLGGGLFLLYKATSEIYEKLEVSHAHDAAAPSGAGSTGRVIFQIILLDIVFSLDSVITAVGMVKNVPIIIVAMVASVAVMLLTAKSIGAFVNRHPSVKILALSFLLLIGVLLVAEGFHKEIPKGYIYFSMAFSLLVELLNMRFRRKRQAAVVLHHPFEGDPQATRILQGDKS